MIEDHLAVATLIFLLAGFVKGSTGLGLPAIVIGLLSLFVPPVQAVALTIVPSFVTNVVQGVVGGHLRTIIRRFWTLIAAVCVGIVLAGECGLLNVLGEPQKKTGDQHQCGAQGEAGGAVGLFL